MALLFTPQTYLSNLRQRPGRQRQRTAKWAADGNGIEVSENSTFDAPEGAINVQMTRSWKLSADGTTLKIDITAEGQNGKQLVKRTFLRK